jgi:Ca2+-binding RTX toxin-like protein
MPALLNSVAATPNAWGVVEGTSGTDRISGTTGTNHLTGNGGGDMFYGGAGNDAFVIKASDLRNGPSSVNSINATEVIYDFGGAGGWSSSNNDFIALTGFGAGSTISLSHYGINADGSVNTNYQTYTVHDTATNSDAQIFVHSLNGKVLGTGDFNFY